LQKLQDQDVPCAKCLSLDEVLSQQQRVANESLATFDHPSMGFMRVMKTAPRFGGEVLAPGVAA
jgi:crotonobetainyl-CoA:carnitine CoA-transferase CaiB-like acyl-CoA transferase